jgi:hypothetical protein
MTDKLTELECICHLQEHGHDAECPRCLADIAGLQCSVADDVPWSEIRVIAKRLRDYPNSDMVAREAAADLEAIANRLQATGPSA